MFSRALIYSIALSSVIVTSRAVATGDGEPLIKLSIDSPNRTGNEGVLINDDWALTFRAEIDDAVAYVKSAVRGLSAAHRFGLNEFIVLRDPDNCLDLRDQTRSGSPITPNCPAGFPDEEILRVHVDRNDDVGVDDEVGVSDHGRCSQRLSEELYREPSPGRLLEPAFSALQLDAVHQSVTAAPLTTPPPPPPPPASRNVSPLGSADTEEDCYGYGRDDDLPALVVIADVGGSRFYTDTFEPDPARPGLKNMAGLLSNVTVELADRRGITSVVATMIVLPGMFDRIAVFDTSSYADSSYRRRIDGGPIETLTFPVAPAGSNPGELIVNSIVDAIPISRVLVRAVLVKGPTPGMPAPDVIEDWNADGKFTADDLVAAGYTLLSNEARAWIRSAPHGTLDTYHGIGGTTGARCVVPAPIYLDLDGDGSAGPRCFEGDGSSGSTVEVPL